MTTGTLSQHHVRVRSLRADRGVALDTLASLGPVLLA